MFKSHFRYTKNQRNGIFSLLLIIATLQCTYYFVDFQSPKIVQLTNEELQLFKRERDSLLKLKQSKKKTILFPFNPNYLTDYKGYQLGMSLAEIDKLYKFRASGSFVNSIKEFQEVTDVSDALLDSIQSYFKFPVFVRPDKKPETFLAKGKIKTPSIKSDINVATVSDLEKLPGIGKTLANRIVNYRKKLGGYFLESQLNEVWNLESSTLITLLEHYTIITLPEIQKIDVNEASFKELLGIVYIDYELTKKILQYRIEVAEIQSLEELKKIDGFPIEKFDQIALYLGTN